jgi:nitrogen regulatory protein PII
MKYIVAFIRSSRIEAVLDGLDELGAHNSALTHVTAVGPATSDPGRSKMNIEYVRATSEMVRLEFYCPRKLSDQAIEIVQKNARTHQAGDGIISVMAVEKLTVIHSGTDLTTKE